MATPSFKAWLIKLYVPSGLEKRDIEEILAEGLDSIDLQRGKVLIEINYFDPEEQEKVNILGVNVSC